MKNKINTGYMLLGAIALFIIVAVVTNADVSGALTYAREAGTSCKDTDFGQDYTTVGEVNDNSGNNFVDSCLSSEILEEYSCNNVGEIVRENHKCAADYSCSNGACIIGEANCIDSDDGRRPFMMGTVTKMDTEYTDYCFDSDTVTEYYCNPINEVQDTHVNCAYGCANGACISK